MDSGVIVQEEMLESDNEEEKNEDSTVNHNEEPTNESLSTEEQIDVEEVDDNISEHSSPLNCNNSSTVSNEVSSVKVETELNNSSFTCTYSPLSNSEEPDPVDTSDFTGFVNVPSEPIKLKLMVETNSVILPAKAIRSYPKVLGPFSAKYNITGNMIRECAFEKLDSHEELTRGLVYEMLKFTRYHKWKTFYIINAIQSLSPVEMSEELVNYKIGRLFGSNGVRRFLSGSKKKKHLVVEFDKMPFAELNEKVPEQKSVKNEAPITSPMPLPVPPLSSSRSATKRSVVNTLISSSASKRTKLESTLPTEKNTTLSTAHKKPLQKKFRRFALTSKKRKKTTQCKLNKLELGAQSSLKENVQNDYCATNGHSSESRYTHTKSDQSSEIDQLRVQLEEQKKINDALNLKLLTRINGGGTLGNAQEDEIIKIIEDKYKTDLLKLRDEHKETVSILEIKFAEAIEMMESNVKKISIYLKDIHDKTIQTLEAKLDETVEKLEKKHETICYQLKKSRV